MADRLIHYAFKKLSVDNAEGTLPITVQNGTVIQGPGSTIDGKYTKAVDLGTSGKASVGVGALPIDLDRFTIRIVFRANGPVTGRQNLVESNLLPFALFLQPRPGSSDFDLVASVAPKAHGWRTATTRFGSALKAGTWYVADLAYDIDTLGVFVDGTIVSVHAFPQGKITKQSGSSLFLGTWVDGARDHFNGAIAAFSWYAGIPDDLEAQLDERRSHAEWFITHKVETVRPGFDLGEPAGPIAWQSGIGASLQPYDRGALMYHDSLGSAFEMHGAIHARYQAMANRSALGYLVSDEVPTTKAGGRKSVFSRGAIYWSGATGAVPVLDQIYLDYEALGESKAIGFPVSPQSSVTGGLQQVFQGARMYHKTGAPRAHEVHGAILTKYLALGGPATWGFPITNESDVKNGSKVVGKFSEFERCTIYWSASTGAWEVHGDIRKKYLAMKGPTGELGFPISDERDIPGVAGAGRYSTFKNATLLWYGSYASIVVARPFRIFIGRIAARESEGAFMGQNDMYIYVQVKDGNTVVYNKRHPSSGDWGGQNTKDVNLTIPIKLVPDPAKSVTFSVDVREADPGNDDHLGKWTKELNAANGWGLLENGGVFDSGSFSKIRSITASVKPEVDIASLTDRQMFWGVGNQGTDDLSYLQYASAFSDVDSETEWWDATDWLDKAFYELVIQDLAENGNCFGMSLEAIYARKGSSLFGLPLDRFTSWNVVRPEVNIKHQYQVGSGPIWWFVKEFITGNTHDPKDVFLRTREEFQRGNHPVLCLSQNYDFSGKPHCVLPIAWDDSSKPWRISISDPNAPQSIRILTVDPDANTFEYIGSATYRGGEWTGGRLHYMPFSLLSSRPRTPIWDAILLILAGTVVILGDDAQTIAITDPAGNDLDAHGSRALAELKAGRHLGDYFVSFKGTNRTVVRDGTVARNRTASDAITRVVTSRLEQLATPRPKGSVRGEILLRMPLRSTSGVPGSAVTDLSALSTLALAELPASRTFRTLRSAVNRRTSVGRVASGRTVYHLANDPSLMRELPAETRELIRAAVSQRLPGDFRHRAIGLRRGDFAYAVKHGLSEIRVQSSTAKGETTQIDHAALGTSANHVDIKTDRDKEVRLEVSNKLGVAGDHVRVAIDRLPVEANKPLKLNLKPGLGGLELVTSSDAATAPVSVEAVIGGKTFRSSFSVPIDGGARLKLSTILSKGTLGVSRIDRLFGPAREVKVIEGR